MITGSWGEHLTESWPSVPDLWCRSVSMKTFKQNCPIFPLQWIILGTFYFYIQLRNKLTILLIIMKTGCWGEHLTESMPSIFIIFKPLSCWHFNINTYFYILKEIETRYLCQTYSTFIKNEVENWSMMNTACKIVFKEVNFKLQIPFTFCNTLQTGF